MCSQNVLDSESLTLYVPTMLKKCESGARGAFDTPLRQAQRLRGMGGGNQERPQPMFTGIITDIGRIEAIEERGDLRVRIGCGYDHSTVGLGASIACSGVCLTVVDKGDDWFAVDVSGETRSRTADGLWSEGSRLNLERSLDASRIVGDKFIIGSALVNLANLRQEQGRLVEARILLDEALPILKAALGEGHPAYATGLNNLALVHIDRGEVHTAVQLLTQALEIQRQALGERHPTYLLVLENTIRLQNVRRDRPAARQLIEQTAAVALEVLGEKHPEYGRHLVQLGKLASDAEQHALSEALLRTGGEAGGVTGWLVPGATWRLASPSSWLGQRTMVCSPRFADSIASSSDSAFLIVFSLLVSVDRQLP